MPIAVCKYWILDIKNWKIFIKTLTLHAEQGLKTKFDLNLIKNDQNLFIPSAYFGIPKFNSRYKRLLNIDADYIMHTKRGIQTMRER